MKKIYRFKINPKNIISVSAENILEAKKAIGKDYPMAKFLTIKLTV